MVSRGLGRLLKAIDRQRAGKVLRASLPRAQRVLESRRLRALDRGMARAENYQQWRALAARHDQASGAEHWKQREDGRLYDARQIRARHDRLAAFCATGDLEQVLFALNEGVHGNMGGMGRATLYQRSRLGTKALIESYVALICKALRQLADAPPSELPFDTKRAFFDRASHCFGRSALAMSGGGGLIYFHHGVTATLLEHDLLPRVLSGSSAGAWVGAQIACRNDTELSSHLRNCRYDADAWAGWRLLQPGRSKFNAATVGELIDAVIPDMTFQEAYEHSGRSLSISVAPWERHQTSRLLNELSSPNVTIRSAARASAAVPGLVDAVQLEAKDASGQVRPYLQGRRWVDGMLAEDLPFKRLSRLYGVNHFIVSMINPLSIRFMHEDGAPRPDTLATSGRRLLFETLKEGIHTARRWVAPVSRNLSDAMLGSLLRIMEQEYVGDINIVLDPAHANARAMAFSYRGERDIAGLIDAGARATWPHLDRIRNATLIGRVIDELLPRLDQGAGRR